MHTPQTQPIPTMEIPGPRLNFTLMKAVRLVMTPYARSLKFREPAMIHGERMVEAYKDFAAGKTRLIVGFRHAYGDDPQLMAYVLHHALPREARRLGTPLKGITHAHFVYGAEVPLWSGPFVRWLLPNVGAVPISHVRLDAEGMNRIRKTLASGPFPLALAPEGHVTYASETVGELETGTARFGFWCLEDLAREGRAEKVVFLPVSSHYRYRPSDLKGLDRLVADIERACGIPKARSRSRSVESVRDRLARCGKEIIATTAAYYRELLRPNEELASEGLLEAALKAAEGILAIEGKGGPFERLYRIRSVAWDRIFRGDLQGMSPLRLELAGRETAEAWYAMRHLETAEILAHVGFGAVPEGATLDGLFEIANNFYDMIGRLRGGTLKDRANAVLKRPVVVTGEPIVIDDFAGLYRGDRRAGLAAVTERIRDGFVACVDEYKKSVD